MQKYAAAILSLLAVFVVGFGLGGYVFHDRTGVLAKALTFRVPGTGQIIGVGDPTPQDFELQDVDFRQFWDLWQILKEKYYLKPVTDKTLFYGAMAGLAGSLGDPYTTYFEPKGAAEFREALNGKFEGIGAEIGIKDDQLQVIAPLPDTPAERAGLLSGDAIIKINKEETVGMTTEKAVSLIRGPRGTKVTLTIFRPSQKKPPFDVTLTRDQIQIKSVRFKMLPQGIAYIEMTHFNGDTEAGFMEAVNKIRQQKNVKGIILDLRNDPGGFLETSLIVAGAWVGENLVVKERAQGEIIQELRGRGPAFLAGVPTIVLVNQGSASASEIVAGALQDHGQATILGTKTFGKGSVQDYQDFKDGSGVKITIAEWVTPKERTINKAGLEPDIVVERTPEDYDAKRDPQLDYAIAVLTGTATSTPATPVKATSTKP